MTEPQKPPADREFQRHKLLQADRFWVERLSWAGLDGQFQTKDVIRHPGAVVILPILEDGSICLIRNQRVSVGQTLLEVPAGTLDQNESPTDCARRELQEETGYTADRMEQLRWFYPSPGILDEKMFLFVATGLTAGVPDRMPDENIENCIVSYDEAMQLSTSPDIQDAKTIIALLQLPHWLAASSSKDE